MAKTTASASGTNRKLRHAGQKEHGHKHDADAQRGNERRHRDLLRAVQNGLHRFFAHRQVAIDVFNFHRGVIHQNAHRQRQSAQGHDVDGFAQRAEAQHAHQNRQRNRDGDDQRAFPVAQEHQDHERRQARGDQRLAQHAIDRSAHEQRLVEQHGDVHALAVWSRRNSAMRLFHALHDIQRGSRSGLIHRHQHAALPIGAHDVGLRRKSIADMRHVAHVNRRAIHGFDRQIVQARDGLRAAVHLHHVFQRSSFAVPVGRIRFCALMAFTMSTGESPLDCSSVESRSTEIRRCLPP